MNRTDSISPSFIPERFSRAISRSRYSVLNGIDLRGEGDLYQLLEDALSHRVFSEADVVRLLSVEVVEDSEECCSLIHRYCTFANRQDQEKLERLQEVKRRPGVDLRRLANLENRIERDLERRKVTLANLGPQETAPPSRSLIGSLFSFLFG